MLLGTFISRPQQICTEPDPPSLGHVPACFAHNKSTLSENIFFFVSWPFLSLHLVNKGTAVTIQTHSFLFAWEQSQLFVGLLLLFLFPFQPVTVETASGTCGEHVLVGQDLSPGGTGSARGQRGGQGAAGGRCQVKPRVQGTAIPSIHPKQCENSPQRFPGGCSCLSFPSSQCTAWRWCPTTRSLVVLAPS